MNRLSPSLGLFPLLLLIAGCVKYKDNPSLKDPAYIRVFNDIPFTQTPYNIGGVVPFLTFLFDPVTDKAGAFDTAAIIGDFLSNRQTFSTSYALNENAASLTNNAAYPTNYDYPGNAHVLAAPSLNGFNLSAWAQTPSGRHRVVFMARPTTSTPFTQLPAAARGSGNILIDTTIDFAAGEVYTLEAVTLDLINNQNQYGLYLRQENFIHQTFYADKIYAGFYNLSADVPPASTNGAGGYNPYQYYYRDSLAIYYTYYTYDYELSGISSSSLNAWKPVPGYDNQYFTTLLQRFAPSTPWLTLPLLSRSSFFNPQGFLGAYGYTLGGNASGTVEVGTLPYVQFTLPANGGIGSFSANANPDSVNLLPTGSIGQPNGSPVWVPNLVEITRVDTTVNFSATVNIIELINNQVFMMQLQRESGPPYNN